MKKLLLGAMGMAVATTAMAAQSETGVVSVPVRGTITIGTPVEESGIKISVDNLEFNGTFETGKRVSSEEHKVIVSRYTGNRDEVLPKGQYKYKVSTADKTWDQVESIAKTQGLDTNPKAFKFDGGEYTNLGSGSVPFALKANATDEGLIVQLDGFISPNHEGKEATVDGTLHVALLDEVVQPLP